jgi:hypothetical protein
MKKIIQFAVKLYPARWRARYGAEFDALLEDMNAGFGDLLNLMKGALLMQIKWSNIPLMAAACGLLGIFLAAQVFRATPKRYASSVKIHIVSYRSPGLPPEVPVLASHVLSEAALTRLIEQNELYPSERRSQSMADVVHRFREDITYRPTPEALQVSFTYPDSQKAQKVESELVRSFMVENFMVRLQEASDKSMNQQAPPRDPTRSGFNLIVTDFPHPVPVGANLIKVLSLGFGGGALAGVAVAMLRRRIQRSAGSHV